MPTGYLAFHKAYSPVVLDASLSVKDLQEFHGLIDEFGKAYRDDAAKKASPFLGWMEGLTARRIVLNKKSVRPARCQSHI